MLIEYIQSLMSLYPYEFEDNCLKFNQINKDAYNYLQSNINKYNIYDDEIEILFYKNKFYRISKFGYISKRVKSNIYYMGSDSSSICLGKRDFTIYFDLVECV